MVVDLKRLIFCLVRFFKQCRSYETTQNAEQNMRRGIQWISRILHISRSSRIMFWANINHNFIQQNCITSLQSLKLLCIPREITFLKIDGKQCVLPIHFPSLKMGKKTINAMPAFLSYGNPINPVSLCTYIDYL